MTNENEYEVFIEVLLTQEEINMISDIIDDWEASLSVDDFPPLAKELQQQFTELWQVEEGEE